MITQDRDDRFEGDHSISLYAGTGEKYMFRDGTLYAPDGKIISSRCKSLSEALEYVIHLNN